MLNTTIYLFEIRACTSYGPDGTRALVSNFGGLIELYQVKRDPRTLIPTFGECSRIYSGHVNEKYSINSKCISAGAEEFIISGSEDNLVYIWNTRDGRAGTLRGHEGVVLSVAYDATSNCLATGCTDGTVGMVRNIDFGAVIASASDSTERHENIGSEQMVVDDI